MAGEALVDLIYDYRPVPTIAEFSASNAFVRGVIGPFGSGKSSGCVVEFPYRAQRQAKGRDGIRRTRWAVVRNTYSELRDTTIQTFHNWLPPHMFGKWHASDHRYVVKAFPETEFEVLFRALDRPEDAKKLLSLDLTGAWVNEARETPWPVIDALMGRCGRYPPTDQGGCTWSGLWMDTNPPDTDSDWYRFFEEKSWRKDFDVLAREGKLPPGVRRPEDYAAIFHQPSGMSPRAENLKNLTAGYYARLGIGKSDEWKKVYIDGRYGFVSDNKAVYPEYNDDLHLCDLDPVPMRTIERSWDWGLTPCCILSQMLPDGRWLIFDEIIATGMGADRFSDQVLEHCARAFRRGSPTYDDIGDPAGDARVQTDERTCFDVLHAKGINIYGGEQNPQMRQEAVRRALRTLGDYGKPRLALHRRCTQSRKAFLGAYYYRKLHGSADRYTTDPEKNHPFSDLMDCVQYRAVDHFGAELLSAFPQDTFPQPRRDDRGRSGVTGY